MSLRSLSLYSVGDVEEGKTPMDWMLLAHFPKLRSFGLYDFGESPIFYFVLKFYGFKHGVVSVVASTEGGVSRISCP